MKLKVTIDSFYDKVEEEYIFKEKTPIIEREEERAKQLIKAGVCEKYVELKKPRKKKTEEPEN